MAGLQVVGGDGLQTFKVTAAVIFNKQFETANKG
jgi:hypothetical protein